jgi:tetratricopeptide (TPR) repeat protein
MSQSETFSIAQGEHQAGRLDIAEALYRRVLNDHPQDVSALIGLGDVLSDAGRADEAEVIYNRAIAIDPDAVKAAAAYEGLAAIRQDKGDLDGAIADTKKAARLRNDADATFAIAGTLHGLGRDGDALELYQLAAQQNHGHVQSHIKAAQLLLKAERFGESIPHYQAALLAYPDMAELHCNLANALRHIGDQQQAMDQVRRAIELKPELAAAHTLLAAVQQDMGHMREAVESLELAAKFKPDDVEALTNLANGYEIAGLFAQATAIFTRATEVEPYNIQLHQNLAGNLLRRGEFDAGWKAYEWRKAKTTNPGSRLLPAPQWEGQPLDGRTIVLYSEQGFGDTIQFLRYASCVVERGAKVIVETTQPLLSLARLVDGVSDAFVRGGVWPQCDFQAALMSLPLVFQTRLESIPARIPYVHSAPDRAAVWKTKLSGLTGKRVGLVWAGSPTHKNDPARSIPPHLLEPLAATEGASFVSLQKSLGGPSPQPPASLRLHDFTDELSDFADTAALLDQLDLVISVDTAVAHLAGAMGKPVWLMLPAINDWRWLVGRDDSPWYPSAKLFRQTAQGDWTGVIDRVCDAMSEELFQVSK